MTKQKTYFTFIFTIILTLLNAQKSVNRYDNNDKRHGLWAKNYYNTNQKRYQGKFEHGKEVDTFKYYTLSKGKSVLSATKVFNVSDSITDVVFYASNTKIISKGQMDGKRYIGQWVYFHKDGVNKMIVERYNQQGKLEGERVVYYKNGNVAEKTHYIMNQLDGESKWYSKENVLLRQSQYTKGQLNGKTANYDSKGNLTSEGLYKKDKKAGIWRYYKNGKITKEIDHTNQKIVKKYE
ncbi:toxin-antitoxin system YwqK family antitoxin [uncultured Winogradskyella sp.]|uniref:toxin-antitoxin system YwqK family antitoxin n=1 Tax=uncultured Winogradskyella sp. TaxID=395353 RepID=UPI00260F19E4|nr:toxin-antitoxin system YwqK family antitoxin [uncultured Winogradskyella sp.]